jgi:rhodanese-related sulfurtransferase
VPEVQVSDLAGRVAAGDAPLVIDIREQSEWDEGHIPGAIHIPRSFLESRIAGVAARDREIILSCASGQRSLLGGTTLQEMGYENVSAWPAGSPAGSRAVTTTTCRGPSPPISGRVSAVTC